MGHLNTHFDPGDGNLNNPNFKSSNARGVARGGMLKFPFDRYIMNIRSHSIFNFISENIRPLLLDLVPRLGCELDKMTSYAQKYLTG